MINLKLKQIALECSIYIFLCTYYIGGILIEVNRCRYFLEQFSVKVENDNLRLFKLKINFSNARFGYKYVTYRRLREIAIIIRQNRALHDRRQISN